MPASSWAERVARAPRPAALWHATTPRKLARYVATGTILPPVRGFDTPAAARAWGRLHGRGIVLRLELAGDIPVWPLPDHHQPEGLAWWTLRIAGWSQ